MTRPEQMNDEQWAKSLVTEVRDIADVLKSPDPTVSDTEYSRRIEQMLSDDVARGWELVTAQKFSTVSMTSESSSEDPAELQPDGILQSIGTVTEGEDSAEQELRREARDISDHIDTESDESDEWSEYED